MRTNLATGNDVPTTPGVLASVPDAISATTRFCAVYGHPIKHSASPAMHNAALAALNLNWRYLAFDVLPEDLAAAIVGAGAMRFIGLNLTVPHKLLAASLVEELDDSARAWGAVNTICFEGETSPGVWTPLGRIHDDAFGASQVRAKGYNTDADAITRSLREELGLTLTGAKVLILGVGGAGRTAALKLAADGVQRLHLVNRTLAKAAEVADEIRRRFPKVDVRLGYPSDEIDLMLNATSLGLHPNDPVPFDTASFRPRQARTAFDMIYRPAETAWLRLARAAGCRVANGLSMLLHQGAAAVEIWTGREAPVARMRRALEANIYGRAVDV